MFSIESLRELYRWMEWADASVWRAVLAAPAAEGDKKLREWLVHIHVVQRAFLHVWTSQSVMAAFKEPSDFASLSAMLEWARPYYAEARRFLDPLDAAALARPVTMPWVDEYQKQLGRTFSTPTLSETMFQVVSHSTYHRGQVNARLRELDGEPPLVDFIAWVWFGKPKPEWT
ncbi:MAG: DinB family protein [Vicinamibacterales bacterium]